MELHGSRGAILIPLGRMPEAREALERAVGFDRGYAPARVNVGTVAASQGDWSEALRHFGEAARLWMGRASELGALVRRHLAGDA